MADQPKLEPLRPIPMDDATRHQWRLVMREINTAADRLAIASRAFLDTDMEYSGDMIHPPLKNLAALHELYLAARLGNIFLSIPECRNPEKLTPREHFLRKFSIRLPEGLNEQLLSEISPDAVEKAPERLLALGIEL